MDRLTLKQKAFADEYLKCGNATEAARRAGYSEKYLNTNATKLLQNTTISQYLSERQKQIEDSRIATAAEIMQYLTSVMRGEIKDQFDLDPPIAERTKAAVELVKRKIDVDKGNQGGGVKIVNNIPKG
ncbi:MAG: terminase small subunit [Acetatifactor sp.]|nr:terminase small subunit [Acetatifactor sp.]